MTSLADTVIEIVCDGGPDAGLGHLSRSSSLGWVLKRAGHSVRVTARSPQGQKYLPMAPGDPGEAGLVIFDLPYEADEQLRSTSERGLPTLGLDYPGRVAPDIDIRLFEASGRAGREVIGIEYAIIRQDVLAIRPAASGHGVLVAIGGGDPLRLARKVIDLIGEDNGPITLIEGPLATEGNCYPFWVRVIKDPRNIADYWSTCSWAVVNGGTTMLEMMSIGKPVHIVPQSQAEFDFANILLAENGVLGVGLGCLELPTPEQGHAVGRRAMEIVDGQGPQRIAAHIESLCASL